MVLTILADHATDFSVPFRRLCFYLGFWVSSGSRVGSRGATSMLPVLSLLVGAGRSASRNTGVGEVVIRLPLLMGCGF